MLMISFLVLIASKSRLPLSLCNLLLLLLWRYVVGSTGLLRMRIILGFCFVNKVWLWKKKIFFFFFPSSASIQNTSLSDPTALPFYSRPPAADE